MIVASIAMKELKLLFKERGVFFWLIVLPILFIVIFGSVFGSMGKNTITVPYIDADHTAASQALLHTMSRAGFKLTAEPVSSLNQQIAKVHAGKEAVLVVIPKGFANGMSRGSMLGVASTMRLYRDAADQTTAVPVFTALQHIADAYRDGKISMALVASGMPKAHVQALIAPPFTVVDMRENAASFDIMTQIVPGYTVMFVFFVMMSIIRRFIGDKESGMTARLRGAGMRPFEYLIGMWIPYFIITVIQCAILLAFGRYVYGLHLGSLTAISAIVCTLALCATSFGIAVAMLVRSENQGMAMTQLVTLGGAAVGGLWFPVDDMPPFLQTIGHFTPQYWAQFGLQNVMMRGVGVAGSLEPMAALVVFSLIGLVVALMRFRRFVTAEGV